MIAECIRFNNPGFPANYNSMGGGRIGRHSRHARAQTSMKTYTSAPCISPRKKSICIQRKRWRKTMSRDCIVTSRLKSNESRFLDELVARGRAKSRSELIRDLVCVEMKRYDKSNGTNWIPDARGTNQRNNERKAAVQKQAGGSSNGNAAKAQPKVVAKQTNQSSGSSESIQSLFDRMQRNHQKMISNRNKRFQ